MDRGLPARNVPRRSALGNVCRCCVSFILCGYVVFEVALVGGDDVIVAAHVGADSGSVWRGVQREQGGGEGFGAVVGEFAREGFAYEAVADVLEVVHACAEGDGDARVQRFERVMAAAGDKAATNECEVADAVVVG